MCLTLPTHNLLRADPCKTVFYVDFFEFVVIFFESFSVQRSSLGGTFKGIRKVCFFEWTEHKLFT